MEQFHPLPVTSEMVKSETKTDILFLYSLSVYHGRINTIMWRDKVAIPAN